MVKAKQSRHLHEVKRIRIEELAQQCGTPIYISTHRSHANDKGNAYRTVLYFVKIGRAWMVGLRFQTSVSFRVSLRPYRGHEKANERWYTGDVPFEPAGRSNRK